MLRADQNGQVRIDKDDMASAQRLEIRVEDRVSAGFEQGMLKVMSAKTKNADVILRTTKADPLRLPRTMRKVSEKYSIYDLRLLMVSEGTEKPLDNWNGETVRMTIACSPEEKEDPDSLQAFYVDDLGRMRWIEMSGYDPDLGAVTFEISVSGIYGIGRRTSVWSPIETARQNLLYLLFESGERKTRTWKQEEPQAPLQTEKGSYIKSRRRAGREIRIAK